MSQTSNLITHAERELALLRERDPHRAVNLNDTEIVRAVRFLAGEDRTVAPDLTAEATPESP